MDERRICKNCKYIFFKKHYPHPNSWTTRRFCCTECRKDFYRNKYPSLKGIFHDKSVEVFNNKYVNGHINLIQSKQDSENADIITSISYYEIERHGNLKKWSEKYNRYRDETKKHILVIIPDERLYEYFDEILFFDPTYEQQ